ncbi:Ig-like domain-containing protein [Peribacillus glennii]|uniref:Ig-like domain-containing protein n=1 Tax=Peribacillus glennii TaxID=2303991 RepID=UPI0013144B81|nr:Ig-like domain-containing protein [Peribacillus glennii]
MFSYLKKSVGGLAIVFLALLFLENAGSAEASGKAKLYVAKSGIAIGETIQSKIQNPPKELKGSFTFTSSNAKVAVVNKTGKITGKGLGSATITARNGKGKLKAVIQVKPDVKKIALSQKPGVIYVNDTFKIDARVTMNPANSKPPKLTYESTDMEFVSVDQKGTVTGLKEGRANIVVKAGAKSVILPVQASSKIEKFDVRAEKSVISPGEQTSLQTIIKMKKAEFSPANIEYEISPANVLSIDDDGTITGLQEGTATIMAIAEDKQKQLTVKVSDYLWTANTRPGISIWNVTWSDDAKLFAYGQSVYDAKTGRVIRTFEGAVDFHGNGLWETEANGKITQYTNQFKRIKTLDTEMNIELFSIDKYERRYTPDGKWLALANGYDKQLINLHTGELELQYKKISQNSWDSSSWDGGDTFLTMSHDGNKVAISANLFPNRNHIHLFDTFKNTTEEYLPVINLRGIDFSKDDRYLVVLSGEGSDSKIEFINLGTSMVDHAIDAQDSQINDFTLSSDGKMIGVSKENGSVEIYKTDSMVLIKHLNTQYNKQQIKLEREPKPALNVSFSPDGKSLLVLYKNDSIQPGSTPHDTILWNVSTLQNQMKE